MPQYITNTGIIMTYFTKGGIFAALPLSGVASPLCTVPLL